MADEWSVAAIMPLYNGSAYCVSALRSVLEQRRVPDEVIIVDDGSTDGSVELLQAALDGELAELVQATGVRVRFAAQTNGGQSAARNEAVALSSCDLVAFIDQDDLWTREHVQLLAARFDGMPRLGWAYSDFDEIDEAGLVVTESFLRRYCPDQPKRTLEELVGADLMVLPSASILRRAAILEVGGFDARLRGYEDDDLYIRMFRAGWSAAFVPEACTSYRVHAGNGSAGPRFLVSRLQFLDNIIATLPDNPRMGRYFGRAAAERLFATTLAECRTAARSGDADAVAALVDTARAILTRLGPLGPGRRLHLAVLRRSPALRRLRRPSRLVPRPVRRAIGRALGLEGLFAR